MSMLRKWLLEHKVYKLLSQKYPDFVWHNKIEETMDSNFNETKKLLAYWCEKGYLKKRDSKDRGEFPDDMLYALTAKGLDELSLFGILKRLLPFLHDLKLK